MAEQPKKIGRVFSRALQNMVTFVTFEEMEDVRARVWTPSENGRVEIKSVDNSGGPVTFDWLQSDIVGFSIGYVGQAPLIETAKKSALMI